MPSPHPSLLGDSRDQRVLEIGAGSGQCSRWLAAQGATVVATDLSAGLVLDDLVEPEWPDDHDQDWGGWSPLRGRLFPGTAIFVSRKP